MSTLRALLAEQERIRRELLDRRSIAKRQADGAENDVARHECDRKRFGRATADPLPPEPTTKNERRRYRRERRGES